MPEIKKTSTAKPTTTAKKGTATSKKTSSSTATAERARKEALRAEVLSVYSAKQNYRATTEMAKEEVIDEVGTMQTSTDTPKLQNVYNTPFFSSNDSKGSLSNGVKVEENEPTSTDMNREVESEVSVPQGKTFADFSRENYSKQELDGGVSEFNSDNYVGLSQKTTTPTKIIKEKKYSRSPRAEKISRFFNYLFTTKEGWYYILGTLCLVFIIVLFFIWFCGSDKKFVVQSFWN